MSPIRILHPDGEFERLIPPLSRAERALLEDSLRKEGCRDPLIVWAGHNIILDGHNRWYLCNLHDIPFRTVDLDLPDREAARNWLIQRQFSRRNLSPAGASYLRGKRYLAEKGKWGGDRVSESVGASGQNDHLLPATEKAREMTTERRLAEEYRVGAKTIRRDAEFAVAVDTLAANCGEQIRSLILSGDARLTRQQMTRLVQLSSQEQRQIFQQLQSGGRLPGLPRPPKRILSAGEPASLARALLNRLGPEQAALVVHELTALIQKKAAEEAKRKMPA